MEGKSMKLEMVSLAWCESMKGLKREREGSVEEGRFINALQNIDRK